jgi:tetratricopeptide (TPR) repeat protein
VTRRNFLPVVTISFLLATASTLSAQGRDAAAFAQADAWIEKADAALSSGSASTAIDLATSALELAPGDSEALLVRARAELTDRATTSACVADLRSAIQSATWRTSTSSMAERTLAQVLVREGKLTEARKLLEPLVRRTPEDPQALLLLARVQDASGDPQSDRTLADAAARFPLIEDFRLLAAGRLEKRGRRNDALTLLGTGLKINPSSLPLLLASARLESGSRRTDAVNAYLQKGGTDPLAAIIGMESAPKSRAQFLDRFLSSSGLSRQDLIDRAAAAVRDDKTLARTLQDALARYTGTRELDANADGFWEEQWSFDRGVVTGWSREPAEDGVPQFTATFQAGKPSALSWEPVPGTRYTARYSEYPFLVSVNTAPGTTLFLVPYSMSFAFLQTAATPAGLAPRPAQRIIAPSPGALLAAAFRQEERGPGGSTVVRTTTLAKGVPTYSEEDLDGDGIMDNQVWYANGVPVRGQRQMQDGSILRETWQGGRLAAAESDTNGDGKVDYRETYGAAPSRTWDFNEDGIPDARESEGTGGTIVRELSTKLNGVFDLRVTYQGTRIVGVTRSGTSVRIVPDAARSVTWIGDPAPGAGAPDLSKGEGLQSIAGRDYLVFLLAGVTYAEAVR